MDRLGSVKVNAAATMPRNVSDNCWARSLELALSATTRVGLALLALVWLSPDLMIVLAGWAGYAGDWTTATLSGACPLETLLSQLGE